MISLLLFRLFGNMVWYKRWQAKRSRKRLEEANKKTFGREYEGVDATYEVSPELAAKIEADKKRLEEKRAKAEDISNFRDAVSEKLLLTWEKSSPMTREELIAFNNQVEAEVAEYVNERYPKKG